MLPFVPQVCKPQVDVYIELQGYELKAAQILLTQTPDVLDRTRLFWGFFWSSIKDSERVRALTLSILSMLCIVRVKSSVQFFMSKQNLSPRSL